jgi:hypothetical protein
MDSTTPQSRQSVAVVTTRGVAGLDAGTARALAGSALLERAPGIQPIMLAMPATLNTITAIAAMSMRG